VTESGFDFVCVDG